jgi:hypothetical protein
MMFLVFSIVLKNKNRLRVNDYDAYIYEMMQVLGILMAFLIDVVGILILTGGLTVKLIIMLVNKCKQKHLKTNHE